METVVPGHGFIGDKTHLAELRECLVKLRREVRKRVDKGISEDQAGEI